MITHDHSQWMDDSVTYLEGKKPSGDVLVAGTAADEFFFEWYETLLNTQRVVKQPLHVHIVHPTNDVLQICKGYLSDTCTFSYSYVKVIGERPAIFYQNIRFNILPELYKYVDRAMPIDFDTMILKRFKFPEELCGVSIWPYPEQSLGMIQRKYNDTFEQHKERHRVLCYATLTSKQDIDYVHRIVNAIHDLGYVEHVDHMAVWQSLPDDGWIDLLYTYICPVNFEHVRIDIHNVPMWTSHEYTELEGLLSNKRWKEKYDYICNNEVG